MRLKTFVCASLFMMLVCDATTSLAQDTARLDQIVQSYVDDGEFTGSVLVAQGDKVLLNKGYGEANREWAIPNGPETKFRIASITKQFTAAAILVLAERGKLNVDDKVFTYLPDAPASWKEITVFHLLTNSTGIPDFTQFPNFSEIQ
ncbi:MAG: beta-lactamase, partial [Rhizobacter sp.]|nr:beta-lactamase [Rhizobacter sp.]